MNPMNQTPKVFVSHSHQDEEIAQRVVADLKAAGADVWVAETDVRSGSFMEQISNALGQSQWVVLIQTPNALNSNYVKSEINTAIQMAMEHKIGAVIPFVVAPCDPNQIPALWRGLHFYDATVNYPAALAGLVRAIGLNQPGTSPSMPAPSSPYGTSTPQIPGQPYQSPPAAGWTGAPSQPANQPPSPYQQPGGYGQPNAYPSQTGQPGGYPPGQTGNYYPQPSSPFYGQTPQTGQPLYPAQMPPTGAPYPGYSSDYTGSLGQPPLPPPPPTPGAAPKAGRSRVIIALIAVATVIVLVAGALLFVKVQNDTSVANANATKTAVAIHNATATAIATTTSIPETATAAPAVTATAIASAPQTYYAKLPGRGCDNGAGVWFQSSALKLTCQGSSVQVNQLSGFGSSNGMAFNGIPDKPFTMNLSTTVTFSFAAVPSGGHACAGIRIRTSLSSTNNGSDSVIVCKDASWALFQTDVTTGVATDLKQGVTVPSDTYTLTFIALGNHLSFYINNVLEGSATDTTFTTTDYIELFFALRDSTSAIQVHDFSYTALQ